MAVTVTVLGTAGILVFAAGSCTSAFVATHAQNTVEAAYDKQKTAAQSLYDRDVADHKTLADLDTEVTAAEQTMMGMLTAVDQAPWLSESTRKAFDQAATDIASYSEDGVPADPLPKPRTSGTRPGWIVDLAAVTDELHRYVRDHEADRETTKHAVSHLTASLANAKAALRMVIAESMADSEDVPAT